MNILKNALPFIKQHLTFKYDIVAPIIATGLVLISGTFISFMIAQNQASDNRIERQNYTDDQIRRINEGITQRLRAYEQFVIAGSSLVRINPELTRTQWRNFIESVNAQEKIFANSSIGYIVKVEADEVAEFENNLQAAGLAPEGIFPDANKPVYFPIKYIEPMTGFARNAVGYDLYSDDIRRTIAESARSSGQVALTPPLGIPAVDDGQDEPTVVALHPVYAQSANLQSEEERTQNIVGYTFIALRMSDLGSRINERLSNSNNAFRLTDITDGNFDHLFATENFDELSNDNNTASETLSVLGRDWLVEFALDQQTFGTNLMSPLVLFTLSMVVNAAGAAFLFMLMIHRQARLAMRHEQEVQKTKDDLLALASHQLRTPATGVKQYIGMVLAGYAGRLTKEQKTMLTKANESNERQLEIINQLLYVAKADAGQLKVNAERFNIVEVVKQVIEEQKDNLAERNINVRLKGKEKAIYVTADVVHIRMILENLLTNAVKYSYPDSIVSIHFSKWHDHVAVHVADRGVGISDKEKQLLFRKFSRIENKLSRQVGGSGIGLFLAQQLAAANGGEIVVDSELDRGSTFTLHIPKKPQKVS